ncbi:unnamed protein product [Saccharomyces cerevisiae]|nr:unnamed protein product [Saccharomyces cerevisiae]
MSKFSNNFPKHSNKIPGNNSNNFNTSSSNNNNNNNICKYNNNNSSNNSSSNHNLPFRAALIMVPYQTICTLKDDQIC